MSSSRRGRKSAADQINHDTTGLSSSAMESAQEAGAQTRSAKRKLAHEKTAVDSNPKHMSSAREPATKKSKTSKSKTTAKTSATDKNSKDIAPGKSQAVITKPSKSASTTIQRNAQLSSKATSEQSDDNPHSQEEDHLLFDHPVKNQMEMTYVYDADDNIVSVNSSPRHEQVNDTKENQEDEYEEEEQTDQEDEDLVDERQGDQDAARYLQNEAPRITGIGSPKERSGRGAHATEEPEENVDTAPAKNVSKKVAQRRQNELPIVSQKILPVSRAAKAQVPPQVEKEPEYMTQDVPPPWLPRTDIVLKSFTEATHTFKVSKTDQNSSIKQVLAKAITYGVFLILAAPDYVFNEDLDPNDPSNDEYCPLTVTGLKTMSFDALIWAAEQLGFDGEYDIADRLEKGDPTHYVDPLVSCVVQRVTLERGTLKGSSAIVLSAYGIDSSPEGVAKARELVRETLYLYPLNDKGNYNYGAPFGHEAITRYMKEVFFGNSKFANNYVSPHKRSLFKSSIIDNPNRALELELPKAMLAMAGCAIHAILLDVGESKRDSFPPSGLKTQWHNCMHILDNLQAYSKTQYHIYIHDLYLKASDSVGLAKHGLSRAEVLKKVDFQAFAKGARVDPTATDGESGDASGTGTDENDQ
ncbi:hypothetical protein EV360DRAFT_88335 [Lentinula raphanica]|nr:hypothetical protein EV360DRAFT_88335 [Lentinula raphanica]